MAIWNRVNVFGAWMVVSIIGATLSSVAWARDRVEPTSLAGQASNTFRLCDELASKLATAEEDTQTEAARKLLKAASAFSAPNPDVFRGWVWQAQAALVLDRESVGREAAKNMLDLGANQSKSTRILAILAALEAKGWLQAPNADESAPNDASMKEPHKPVLGVISSSDGTANLRQNSSKDSDLLETLENGNRVTVLSQDGDWWEVKTSSGHSGYLKKSLIQLADQTGIIQPVVMPGVIQSSDGIANLRKEQSKESELVETLENGATVTILTQDADWWKVRTQSGRNGYMKKSLIRLADQAEDPKPVSVPGSIQSSDGIANLRKERSKESELIEALENGASVTVLNQDGEWWQVRTQAGRVGYMRKSLIELSQPSSQR